MSPFRLAGVTPILVLIACSQRLPQQSLNQKRTSTVQAAIDRQVRNAVDAGDGDAIARALRERLASNPANLNVRLELAEHYRHQGFGELALEHYRLAAERFPDNAKVALLIARISHEMQMTAQAAETLDQFLAKHPNAPYDLPAWLGILRDELGQLQAAEAAHRMALRSNPSNPKLHNNLGYNLLVQGKRDEAIAELRRALALDARMDTARNNLGMALMRGGSPQDQKEALLQWQSISDPATAHNNVAAMLMEQGLYSEARQELETALQYRRLFTPALKNLELLSHIDGRPAVIPPLGPAKPSWKRNARRFWYIVAGIDDTPDNGGVTLATGK